MRSDDAAHALKTNASATNRHSSQSREVSLRALRCANEIRRERIEVLLLRYSFFLQRIFNKGLDHYYVQSR